MKRLILAIALFPVLVLAQGSIPFTPAVIFNGDFVRALRSQVDINGSASILTGGDDPTVVAKDAPQGSMYLRTGSSGGLAYLKQDNGSSTNWLLMAGTGTVTSVGLSLPSIFTVSGSPVSTSGTLTGSLNTQVANSVWSGPMSGGAAQPTFRSLVTADIPGLPASKITSGQGTLSTSTSGVTVGTGTNTLLSNATVDIATANGSQNGLLSSSDWTTFNGKQAAGSYITALTNDVTATGPGSAAATVAKIRGVTVSTTPPTNGQVLTYNSTSLQWEPQPAGSSGANTSLSNLTTTNINQNLILNTGRAAIVQSQDNSGGSTNITFKSGDATGGGFTSGNTTLSSGAGDNGTGNVTIVTGDVGVTGNSGGVTIQTGSPAGGTRGSIKLVDGSESGGSGYVLTLQDTLGTAKWMPATGGGGTPAGLDTQIQFNNSGAFGASSSLTYNTSNGFLQVGTITADTVMTLSGSPITDGTLSDIYNVDATISNTSFGGQKYESGPGDDFEVGKKNVNTATYFQIRKSVGPTHPSVEYVTVDQSGNVGIGFTTPSNKLEVNGSVLIAGFLITSGTTPLMGSCGTSPSVVGNDTAGRITVGTGGSATSCAMTFSASSTNAPICTVQDETTALVLTLSPTTGGLTITSATPFGASDTLAYHCIRYQ